MDANATGIKPLLDQDLARYQHLLELLHQEKSLLVKRDFDAFAAVLEAKHKLLLELERSCNERAALVSSLGFENNEAGMQSLITKQPEFGQADLLQNWSTLKDLVTACNRQNQVNAKIAHRAQNTSRQILNILKGAPPTANLYGKSGTTAADELGLSITRA